MTSAPHSNHAEHELYEALLVGGFVFIALCALTIPTTWELGSDWGPFSRHWPALWAAAKGWLFGDLVAWTQYKAYLLQSNQVIDFTLHLVLPATLALIAACIAVWYVVTPRKPERHVEGPRLYQDKAAIRHAKHCNAKERKGDPMGAGIHLHPQVAVPMRRELGNLFCYGMQGSGKGVVLKPILDEILSRGDSMLIYDQKQEYTPLFYGESAVLISPTDQRSMAWDIAADATTDEQALLIASSLIAETREPIWSDGSRLILAGCIVILNREGQPWGWAELAEILALPEADLRQRLELHFPQAARFIESESKMTQSLFATIISNLGWIYTLSKAWPQAYQDSFSISRWLDQPEQQLIIVPADERFSHLSGPLCNALLSLMVSQVLALPDDDERRIWFALDELGNLPKCHKLEAWLSLGRSKGARTLAGTQNISQLHSIYGEHTTETLLALFSNVICLRLGASGQAADVASAGFGERIIERPVFTLDQAGNRSTTWQREAVPVVRPEQIKHLPQADRQGVTGFLACGGWSSVYRLKWPYPSLPKIAPEYQPADWLSPEEPPVQQPEHRRTRGRRQTC